MVQNLDILKIHELSLLNILFISFFMIFLPMIIEKQLKNRKLMNVIYIALVATSILLCMHTPIFSYDGLQYDLRYSAMIVSGLYGGMIISFPVWLVTVIGRWYFGGSGFLPTLFLATFVFVISAFVSKKFMQYTLRRKLFAGFYLSFISSLCIIAVFLVNSNAPFSFPLFFSIIFYQIASVLVLIYFIEYIHQMMSLERRVIATDKMEIVSFLASSISHEVRNPLTVVRGFLQMMLSTDLEKQKRDEYLKIAISEIDRANRIIGDYLKFSKPNAGEPERLQVEEELNRLKEMITPLANMNSVVVETHFEKGIILGNSALLQQCLLNIVKNCIEAMPNGGILTMQTKVSERSVTVKICDTGYGMTKEQIEQIGNPYFSTKGDKGTGLGMMVAKQIIEDMNGQLTIHSKKNQGTKFLLTFPRVYE